MYKSNQYIKEPPSQDRETEGFQKMMGKPPLTAINQVNKTRKKPVDLSKPVTARSRNRFNEMCDFGALSGFSLDGGSQSRRWLISLERRRRSPSKFHKYFPPVGVTYG